MDCSQFDWKGHALGELAPAEAEAHARHLDGCARCREEVAALTRVTSALKAIPQAEPPRRIVFAPEPQTVAPWWRRMRTAGPQWAFAGAALLALAIVAHGWMIGLAARSPMPLQAGVAPAGGATQQQLEQRVAALVDARMQEKLGTEVRMALTDFQKQINERDRINNARLEQRVNEQRESDRKAVSYAYERLERRLNYALLSARNGGGQ